MQRVTLGYSLPLIGRADPATNCRRVASLVEAVPTRPGPSPRCGGAKRGLDPRPAARAREHRAPRDDDAAGWE